MTAGPIGLIANPASGKDIRRLVAHASVFDNAEKASILRRVILGAVAAGATEFLYMPDDHDLVGRALEALPHELRCSPVAQGGTATAADTTRAAERMRTAGCAVVVTLGGDGTNRAAALGWPGLPLIAISTGTNNVFPSMIEATVAGSAAGLVASGAIPIEAVARRAKRVDVQVEDEQPDLALIDAAVVEGAFAGARALWEPAALRCVVLARAEPAAVGLSAVGGLLDPISDSDDAGLWLEFGAGGACLNAPIAPGLYREIGIRSVRRLSLGESVEVTGPALLAFDGERERPLRGGRHATFTVRRDGPLVVDVRKILTEAAKREIFVRRPDSPSPQPLSQFWARGSSEVGPVHGN